MIEGGGAEKAGIQANDIITKINDVDIVSPIDFQKAVLSPGDTVNVTILRDGQQTTIPVLSLIHI